jgi:hypothetical protein
VRFGVTLPNLGVGNDPAVIIDLAVEVESAGWDAVFVWDTPYASDVAEDQKETFDAWALMTAIALKTERVQIGTMITPLAWRRPWEIARQSMTLDRLSQGRFILCVGLGWVPEGGSVFHEVTDRKTRAAMLDEGLAILTGLWSGRPFSFKGEHYELDEVRFVPSPLRKIPVWVVGAWNRDQSAWPMKRSMRRALRWDGVLPNVFGPEGNTHGSVVDDIRAMAEWIRSENPGPFDIVCEGGGEEDDVNADAKTVREWADAGATWWLEAVWYSMYRHPGNAEPMRERIKAGPPGL